MTESLELGSNGSLHPPALKEQYGSTVSGLASPIQPIQRLQPPLHITVGGDSLGLPARPGVKRNASDDDSRSGVRLDVDMQPPSYSALSVTVTAAEGTPGGTYSTHGLRQPETIWSAPAGTAEFPPDVQRHGHGQQYPPHQSQPLTPQNQQRMGGGVHDRRASIVGYTGFEPYPQGGKLGLNVSGTGQGLRPTSSQQYQQKQHYQSSTYAPGTGNSTTGYVPMITGYPPKSGLDTSPNGGSGAQTQTMTRHDYDYSFFHTSTSGASRAHPPAPQQQTQQHGHRTKPELSASACPSDISASSSVMPLELEVDEAVNGHQAGYEHRADGFVYPVNQVFPSPVQPGR